MDFSRRRALKILGLSSMIPAFSGFSKAGLAMPSLGSVTSPPEVPIEALWDHTERLVAMPDKRARSVFPRFGVISKKGLRTKDFSSKATLFNSWPTG